ncbi:MAG TPA: ATP synthase F1 subunit delta [Planctomycetota bacterium]|nr:ATP synthase F1 subunit delta [Planctomycetota bacterium]
MTEKTLAKRYAAALLRVSDAEGATEETETLLLALKDVYRRDKAFRAVLAQPRIPRKTKKALLRRAFEGRAPAFFVRFLDLLVDKGRLEILPEVADVFDRLADASKGIVRVRVRSWKPLSEDQRARLSGRLAALTGKKIEIQAEADPSVGGGLLVHIGDTVIDGTAAFRLREVAERFRELQRR